VKIYHIANPDEYGLYVPPGETPEEVEVWLPRQEPIAGANLPNLERMKDLEFRMVPWVISIQIPTAGSQQISLDPLATCEQTLHNLLKQYNLPPAEYCLKVNDEVLQEPKSLYSSSLVNPDNRSKLVLCERPLRLKVILTVETSQMMEFDPNLRIAEVFDFVAKHVNLVSRNFVLALESDEHEPVILDDNESLKNHVNSDSVSFYNLQEILKPPQKQLTKIPIVPMIHKQ
jgi:sulfur carrier protein ThiS